MTRGDNDPPFGSREEEARFWDQLDVSTLPEGHFEDAEVQVGPRGKPVTTTLAIRFDQRTVQLLRAFAKAKGLGATQVVRAWVLERLRLEQEAGTVGLADSVIDDKVAQRVEEKLDDPDFRRRLVEELRSTLER